MPTEAKAVELECVLTGYSRLKDRGLSLRLATMAEAPVELVAWIDERHGQAVTVLIADDRQAAAMDYKGSKNEKGQTPSQQLRNRLYSMWQHTSDNGDEHRTFEKFYDDEMGDIISNY